MTEKENAESGIGQRISEDERFRYIGFEAFSGPPKGDLFKNEAEQEQYVKRIREKLERRELIREDSLLLEERVSGLERVILLLASLLVVGSLFLPWFSAYNQVVEEITSSPTAGGAVQAADTVGVPAEGTSGVVDTAAEIAAAAEATPPAGEPAAAETAEPTVTGQGLSGSEEIITAQVTRKKIHREYARLTGLGFVLAAGSYGGAVFASGFGVILTALVLLVYILLCVAVPVYTIVKVFTLKGDKDQVALQLKKVLRVSWIPVIVAGLTLLTASIGGEYGGALAGAYDSLGNSFGLWAYLANLSWGLFVSVIGFIIVAAKGVEI